MLAPVLIALAGMSASMARKTMKPLELASSSCSASLPASCQNSTTETDLCCFEAQGLIQHVQLWDTDPVTGPTDSWTIHGLWPNYCDGSYTEDCGPSSRDYDDISTLLQNQGASDTLNYMNTYWLSDDESNEAFWEHEWDTHGTCYTTLQPSCFPSSDPTGSDAVAFFETVVGLFKTIPTYSYLEQAGITPSEHTTYKLSELNDAIQNAYGYTASFDCDDDELYQIEYWFNVQGSVANGDFVPIDAFESGSCRSSGIKYLPKSSGDDSKSSSSGSEGRRDLSFGLSEQLTLLCFNLVLAYVSFL